MNALCATDPVVTKQTTSDTLQQIDCQQLMSTAGKTTIRLVYPPIDNDRRGPGRLRHLADNTSLDWTPPSAKPRINTPFALESHDTD